MEFIAPQPGANSLACVEGHSFDMARQGYLNLLTGHGTKFLPDTAAMVNARDAFLDAGHYRDLSTALAKQVEAALPPTAQRVLLVDAGTGTGYYLQQILLVIFAPRNASEFARILKPGGSLIVVTPQPTHLGEIAEVAGLLTIQEEKEAALSQSMASHFSLVRSEEVVRPLDLAPADVGNVALMGPAGHHLDPVALGKALAQLPDRTRATAAFRISVFAPTVPA